MIVVVDTNVWISAILNKNGTPRVALEKALDVDVIAICDELLQEIIDVLERKFSISPADTHNHLKLYIARAVYVTIDGTEQGCRDSEDDMVIECAKKSRADFIVTGDRDLLDMGSVEGIRIITARQYIEGELPLSVN